jgi:hypothetical protein
MNVTANKMRNNEQNKQKITNNEAVSYDNKKFREELAQSHNVHLGYANRNVESHWTRRCLLRVPTVGHSERW